DHFYIKRTLRTYGVRIISATEPAIDNSNSIASKVYESFASLQAEIDNCIRSERTTSSLKAKLASGILPWKPPIGYLPQGAKKKGQKKLEADPIDPLLFPIIQASLREFSTGNYGQKGLREVLDARGFAKVRKCKTHPQLVFRILFL